MNYNVNGSVQYSTGGFASSVNLTCVDGIYTLTINDVASVLTNPNTVVDIKLINGVQQSIRVMLNVQLAGVWLTGIFN